MAQEIYSSRPLNSGQYRATIKAFTAVEKGRLKQLTEELAAGADLQALKGDRGYRGTLLHYLKKDQLDAPEERKQSSLVVMTRLLIERGAHPNAPDSDGRTPFDAVCDCVEDKSIAVLAALAQEGASLATTDKGHGKGYVFSQSARKLWNDAARRLRGIPLWDEKIIKEQVARMLSEKQRPIADAFNIEIPKGHPETAYHFLSAIRALEDRVTTEKALERLDSFHAKEWFNEQAQMAMQWLTPARTVRHLASVMPACELFSPDRWRGHEAEAVDLIAQQRPWLRHQVSSLVPLLQGNPDRRKLEGASPLRGWKQSAGWKAER